MNRPLWGFHLPKFGYKTKQPGYGLRNQWSMSHKLARCCWLYHPLWRFIDRFIQDPFWRLESCFWQPSTRKGMKRGGMHQEFAMIRNLWASPANLWFPLRRMCSALLSVPDHLQPWKGSRPAQLVDLSRGFHHILCKGKCYGRECSWLHRKLKPRWRIQTRLSLCLSVRSLLLLLKNSALRHHLFALLMLKNWTLTCSNEKRCYAHRFSLKLLLGWLPVIIVTIERVWYAGCSLILHMYSYKITHLTHWFSMHSLSLFSQSKWL